MNEIKVIKGNVTLREYLIGYHLSKTNIYKLSQDNRITLNYQNVTLDQIVKENDIITIDESINYIPTFKAPLKVVYEDQDILVVFKDADILVHSDGNSNNTLSNIVAFYYQKTNQDLNVYCLHRLDKATSGIVVFPKNLLTLAYLSYQLEHQEITKRYQAIVHGKVTKGVIDSSIGRDRHNNNRYIISKTGKKASTSYQVITSNNKFSLIDVQIKTGRTHQIRVHMQSINHPIVGDSIYGLESDGKLMLLAYEISFYHPQTKSLMTVTANESLSLEENK